MFPRLALCSLIALTAFADDPKMAGVELIPHLPYPKGFGGALEPVPLPKFDLRNEPPLPPGITQRFGQLSATVPRIAQYRREDASVAFSPDGEKFAAWLEAGQMRVWESATMRLLGVPTPPPTNLMRGSTHALTFSPDGSALWGFASTGVKGDIDGRAIDINVGLPLLQIPFEGGEGKEIARGRRRYADLVLFSGDGRAWVARHLIGRNNRHFLLSVADGSELGTFPELPQTLFVKLWQSSRGGGLLAYASHQSAIGVVKLGGTGTLASHTPADKRLPDELRFLDGEGAVRLRSGARVVTLDIASGKATTEDLPGDLHAMSPDGAAYAALATIAGRRVLTARRFGAGAELFRFTLPAGAKRPWKIVLSPGLKYVAVLGGDTLTMYRAGDGRPINSPPPFRPNWEAGAIPLPNGEWLAVADGGLATFHPESAVPRRAWRLQGEEVWGLKASADGTTVAIVSFPVGRHDYPEDEKREFMARLLRTSDLGEVGRVRGRFLFGLRPDIDDANLWRVRRHELPSLRIDFAKQTAERFEAEEKLTSPHPSASVPTPAPCLPQLDLSTRYTDRKLTVERDPGNETTRNSRSEIKVCLASRERGELVRDEGGDQPIDPLPLLDSRRNLVRVVPTTLLAPHLFKSRTLRLPDLLPVGTPTPWPIRLEKPVLLPGGRLIAALEPNNVVVVEASTNLVRHKIPLGDVIPLNLFAAADDASVLIPGSDGAGHLVPTAPRGVRSETPLTAQQLGQSWADLLGEEGAKVEAAIRPLAARPGESVPYLAKMLPTRDRLDPKIAAEALDELARDAAGSDPDTWRAIRSAGPRLMSMIVGRLRKLPALKPGDEATPLARRYADALDRLRRDALPSSPDLLRQARAVEALIRADTGAALALLATLAERAGTATLQLEAMTR